MKERPIIMQAESVRAILDGRKTQTRRVLKHQACTPMPTKDAGIWGNNCDPVTTYFGCPHGQPGDRLWVKEAWGVGCRPDPFNGWNDGVEYKADCFYLEANDILPLNVVELPSDVDLDRWHGKGWQSPLFMPRWASRIALELVNVRVERVQDISEADAKAEGCQAAFTDHLGNYRTPNGDCGEYHMLWDSIHGKNPARMWEANPWVWVLEFRRINP